MKKDIFDRLLEISERNTFNEKWELVATNPIKFIEEYGTFEHPTKGLIKSRLYEHQRALIHSYHENRLNIVYAARQTGLTETGLMYALYSAFFNDNKTVIIASHKTVISMHMLNSIMDIYCHFPQSLKDKNKVVMKTKHQISFDNGSEILITGMNSTGTRGYSADLILVDNVTHINGKDFEDFYMTAVPSLNGKGKMILMSSAGGGNRLFNNIWNNACAGKNDFMPHKIAWNMVPERDSNFKDETIKLIGSKNWSIQYELPMIKEDHEWPEQQMLI